MTRKLKFTTQMIVRVTKADRDALEDIRRHEGITLTHQIHQAIQLWLARWPTEEQRMKAQAEDMRRILSTPYARAQEKKRLEREAAAVAGWPDTRTKRGGH